MTARRCAPACQKSPEPTSTASRWPSGTKRARRCATRFPDGDLLVFGHSHIPWDSVAPNGMRLLNPGSPTDRRRQPYATYLTATITAGRVTDVQVHGLPSRADSHDR